MRGGNDSRRLATVTPRPAWTPPYRLLEAFYREAVEGLTTAHGESIVLLEPPPPDQASLLVELQCAFDLLPARRELLMYVAAHADELPTDDALALALRAFQLNALARHEGHRGARCARAWPEHARLKAEAHALELELIAMLGPLEAGSSNGGRATRPRTSAPSARRRRP